MAQTIQLKRSSVAGNLPTSSDLALGEIAINTADGAVYIKKGNDDIVAVADNDILHIDTSNGRVGIGTTTPDFALHVKHASTNVVGRFESGDNQVWIDLHDDGSGTYGALLGHDSDAGSLFMVADANVSQKFVIKDNGNVGINNVSPDEKLHISGGGIKVDGEATIASGSGTGVSTCSNC